MTDGAMTLSEIPKLPFKRIVDAKDLSGNIVNSSEVLSLPYFTYLTFSQQVFNPFLCSLSFFIREISNLMITCFILEIRSST